MNNLSLFQIAKKISLLWLVLSLFSISYADNEIEFSSQRCMQDGINPTLCANAFSRYSPNAYMDIGQIYEKEKLNYKVAYLYYEASARLGNEKAQYLLGSSYLYGKNLPQDSKQAIYWFEKAANSGLKEALYTLGRIYQRGEGVPQSDIKAKYWYQRATKHGNKLAEYAFEKLEKSNNEEKPQNTPPEPVKHTNNFDFSTGHDTSYYLGGILVGFLLLAGVGALIASFARHFNKK